MAFFVSGSNICIVFPTSNIQTEFPDSGNSYHPDQYENIIDIYNNWKIEFCGICGKIFNLVNQAKQERRMEGYGTILFNINTFIDNGYDIYLNKKIDNFYEKITLIKNENIYRIITFTNYSIKECKIVAIPIFNDDLEINEYIKKDKLVSVYYFKFLKTKSARK